MIRKWITSNKVVLLYGVGLAGLLFVLKWLELRLVIINHAFEVYIGAIAVTFTALGIWMAQKLTSPRAKTIIIEKDIIVEKQVYVPASGEFHINEKEIHQLGLSKREVEVLQLMAQGLSNQEIAHRLFVSLNTVKTHSSKLFEKMEVKRRTQAIEKAKRLSIIP
jgi:DNA-binding CsgD family transcriptional regulator